MNRKEDIYRLLKHYWGFNHFRSLQEDIILSVLEGKDTLALLPTGGGKSLCFQVPGLALGGTTLVVSPLIALMNDQVHNLRRRGISAVAISAAMNQREISIALNNAALGHVQFLYISPERLQNENFRKQLSHLPVTLIAVDEAHCISQWGFDFRPSYRRIAELRAYFEKIPILALTASATQEVANDIQKQLQFSSGNVCRLSFERHNLRYVVQAEEDKAGRLLKLINNLGGAGIVYVRNRKSSEETAKFLKRHNIEAKAYHAGLKYEDRKEAQQQWIENKVRVICATNAFGMGIDKADVRFVVHLDLPESMEAYFQEAGRAGRDGKTAYAAIFYTGADKQRLLDNHRLSFPEPEFIKRVYEAICNYYQVAIGAGIGTNVDFDLDGLRRSYNLPPLPVFNSIKFLEKQNYLSLIDAGFEPSKVMIMMGKEDLYDYEIRFPKFEPLLKTLLRSYGGLLENYVFISEKELAYRVKLSVASLTEQLGFLNKEGVLSYIPQSGLPKLVFTANRVQPKYMEFNPENYKELKERHLKRIESIINYVDNTSVCRQGQLLLYFDEKDFDDCGYCDVCLSKKTPDSEKIKLKLKGLLKTKALSLEQIKAGMNPGRYEVWVYVLNQMVDDGIVLHEGLLYKLKT